MIYVHAALLLHAAGKDISADSISKMVKAAGITPDEAQIKSLVAVLEGVNIEEALASAPMMMAAASSAAPAAASSAAPAASGKSAPAPKEEHKEQDLGLDSLFG